MTMSPFRPADRTGCPISPELALVDPDLASSARMLLPDPGEPERARLAPSAVTATSRAEAQVVTARKPAGTPAARKPIPRSRLAAVTATGVAVITAGVLGLVPAAGHRASDVTLGGTHAQASALQVRAARQARAARIYTWPAVPGAETYEFKILRGAQVIFETKTTDSAVELPAQLPLFPGRHTWSVTPMFTNRPGSATRPLVEVTFLVAPL
jgi:hypothetical protein